MLGWMVIVVVNVVARVGCRAGQFRCGTGDCVDAETICDGKFDCLDAADERDCSKCTTFENRALVHTSACIFSSKCFMW